MERERPLVLVAEGAEAEPLAWLRERASVVEAGIDDPEFADAISAAQGLLVRSYTKVDAALLEQAPALRVVGRGGVGLESIDVPACRDRGVTVVYTPEANSCAVAEFVTGMAVRLVRPFHLNELEPWTGSHFKRLRADTGEQLQDLTLGILGMGRVGLAVAGIMERGLGMRVRYHDLRDVRPAVESAGLAAEAVGFDDLVTGCDVLSLHVDGRPGNRHLIDRTVLEEGAFRWLINTSRGLVLDATALSPALSKGLLQGVAVDVFDPEPPTADSPWVPLLARWPGRVLLTPHMASRTTTAVQNMGWVVRDVMAVLEGRPPRYPAP
jgi:D-3-phosphoglycerate dehydrogenase